MAVVWKEVTRTARGGRGGGQTSAAAAAATVMAAETTADAIVGEKEVRPADFDRDGDDLSDNDGCEHDLAEEMRGVEGKDDLKVDEEINLDEIQRLLEEHLRETNAVDQFTEEGKLQDSDAEVNVSGQTEQREANLEVVTDFLMQEDTLLDREGPVSEAPQVIALDEKSALGKFCDAFEKIGEAESQEDAVNRLIHFAKNDAAGLNKPYKGSRKGEEKAQTHFFRWVAPSQPVTAQTEQGPAPSPLLIAIRISSEFERGSIVEITEEGQLLASSHREFLKFAKFQLKAKFIPDDGERKELWTLALLRAFKKFDDLKDSTLTIEEQEQKFGEDLLAAVTATILDPKESEHRQFEERYITIKRERGNDLFQALVKEDKLLAKAKVKGYKLDPSTQKRTLEKMCWDKE
uniref:Uncharacterized protein n=1 Tax=Chromera velia CCMP2878 TaxID=1169474 RepID=A0A0G4H3Y0_9ALVE|eukprot:Cvel_24549.t1-p1 / transcript=Cvel_24549.t1 / gene=Cvel_24549 / organism=Chromera_velia_CCMP2878 / gene_product=hypothetical protein / transcript_product=hypothetical protein / location=Cvel_scaffold2667:17555-24257(-) / protein_length=404 / sequence_SO=supercontig / SO=protein_coding / is_pseudo=false